jgi:HAD superfamily phosphatase (TIGR01668 family)
VEIKLFKFLCPDEYYDSIFDIDLDKLKRKNIEGIIIDLDNTLVPWGEEETTDKLHHWLKNLKNSGFKVCIVSNNRGARTTSIANKLNLPIIEQAWKPRKKAFKKAILVLRVPREKLAVVGDQIFTDVFGGKRMNMKTILVVPISKKELYSTRILRLIERKIINNLMKKNLLKKNG